MDNLLPIRDIRERDVLAVVRQALRGGLGQDCVENFVASVDWSGEDTHHSEARALLGQLEGWASEYASGNLSEAQYVSHLLTLLPSDERPRYYVSGGAPIGITVSMVPFFLPTITVLEVRVAEHPEPVVVRSSLQPQTGFDDPQDQESAAESNIALAV